MKLIPCTPELLQLACALARDPAPGDIAPEHLKEGLSWAMIEDGYLLGVGGVIFFWPGRCVAWLRVTRFARPRHVVKGLRWTRAWFDQLQRNPLFRRIEINVQADSGFCASMAQALGFGTPEALQRGWGPDGRDYYVFARVT